LRYLKDVGKQIFGQDCPNLGALILAYWAGYVGFKLGGYKQPGSKENKGSVNDSSWREMGFAIAPVCMYKGSDEICVRDCFVLVKWKKNWSNKGTDETGLP